MPWIASSVTIAKRPARPRCPSRKLKYIPRVQETPSRRQRHKSNCHGLTFLDGDYWLLGSQVDRILDDNDWVIIKEAKAKPGDVAVYRDWKGRIVHTAKVTGRDAANHILVNSKNGFDKEIESVRAVEVVPY